MKKTIFAIFMCSLLIALSACAASTKTATATQTTTALSGEEQMLVGTINLENTDLAVSAAQASQLLPLWETLQSMSTSGTGATAEVDALVEQIKTVMTADQLSKITNMALTQQDVQAAMASTGSNSASSGSTSSVLLPSAGGNGAPTDGGPAGGGNPPVDMGAGMGGQSSSGSVDIAQAAAQATSSTSAGNTNKLNSALIDALVKILQKKSV